MDVATSANAMVLMNANDTFAKTDRKRAWLLWLCQLRQIVGAMLTIAGRVTMVRLARWTGDERAGSQGARPRAFLCGNRPPFS